jgi:hypothetical protein
LNHRWEGRIKGLLGSHHLDGAVVMTNAEDGTRLAEEIMQSIASEYGWPDFRATVRSR